MHRASVIFTAELGLRAQALVFRVLARSLLCLKQSSISLFQERHVMTEHTAAATTSDTDLRWLLQRGFPAAIATSGVIGLTVYFLCTVTAGWLL
ncbi:MAG: hypothetical protein R3E54_03595 [Halioglobus sp.]